MLYDYLLEPTFTQSVPELNYFFALGTFKQLVPEFQLPSKKLDKKYSNQYDLWLKWADSGICVEVKASRAVDFEKPDEPLYVKALSCDSKRPFDMNF